MFGKPKRQFGFSDFTRCKAQKCQTSLFLAGSHGSPVELEKDEGNLHRSSLVAVDKRVIAGDSESVCCRQVRQG